MSKYVFGQYLPNQSLLHHLDPRTKFIGSVLLTASVFAIRGWSGYLVLLLSMIVLIWLSRLKLNQLWAGLRLPLWFVLLALIMHTFTTPGHMLWQVKGIGITSEGLAEGMRVGLRVILLATTGIILMATTSSVAITTALEVLLMPLYRVGVPVRAVALMMGMALRFIPILFEEAGRLKRAQLSRGGRLEDGPFWQRLKTLYALVIPMVVLTVKRADYLAQAMEARGFGHQSYTKVQAKALQRRDYLSLVICVAIVIVSYLAK